jgi:septal ring factor EnvC (AmiA/AmiB activator)
VSAHSVERRTSRGAREPLNAEQQLFGVAAAHHCTPMGCGSSMPVHPVTEGGAETNARQAMAQQIAALRSENVALQEKLTSTRSDLADAKQTIVALQEQLTSTRSELANAVTREQSATGRLSFLASMDKERIATLELELAELETSACSASHGALITLVDTTAQAYPGASPAQVLGDTPVEAAVLEMDPTKSMPFAL